MEYVQGKTLKQIIRETNAAGDFLPVSRVLDLIIQVCQGIGYAHRADLVHCDVKPQNILITEDDRVKVADFGIARAVSQVTAQQPDSVVWGTPQYFSPEQAAGEPPSPSSDVYALGVVLFEMLASRLPFEADSHTAMALKHLHTLPPLVSTYNPAVPPQLVQIVKKVLAKEPSGRYRTAGQMARILEMYRQRSKEDTAAFAPVNRLNNGETILSPGLEGTAIPVAEQKTQIFSREEREAAIGETAVSPYQSETRLSSTAKTTSAAGLPESDPLAIVLGIIALLLLLGLIPFWYYVYISLLS
jgi:serine/threonine-protein kinase